MEFFFNPGSVAVVGASQNPFKFGSIILTNLFNLGYKGKIFPVNPKGGTIAGLKTYPSVGLIPDELDLAILAVPASATIDVMRDCAEKRVKGVVIISSGFNEAGERGMGYQDELLKIARSAGMRIVGPNTTGILNPHDRFTTTFVLLRKVKKGDVAFIAQTGMFAGMLMEWILTSECFGVSKVAGLGNKCDVDDAEMLDYLRRDEHTRVIMMYIESIKDGRRFMEAARATTRHKPILALKAGHTNEGAAAAMSHTGSLAGNDAIISGAFKQAGVLRVDSFQQLIDYAKMFAYQPVARGNRLAIVSLSGGAAVMSADAAFRAGFRLAHFSEELLAPIQERYPAWARVRHPFDIEPLTETVGFQPAFEMTVRCALSNPEADACVVITWTPFPETGFSFDFIHDLQREFPGKPLAFCSIGYKEYHELLFQQLESLRIPVYPSFTRAIDSLAASAEYGRYLQAIGGSLPERRWETKSGTRTVRTHPKKNDRSDALEPASPQGICRKVRVHFDGASHGNPGPAAIGVVITNSTGKAICELSEAIGRATNNYAEYAALIRGLEEAQRLGAAEVECFADSELVVRQITGQYSIKSKTLLPLVRQAQELRRQFTRFSIRHIPREQNKRADSLASKALKKTSR
ncbi:MAG: reverse transcriptase-like protein [Candidatus Abyssobacteria bacterium SURF_17]|uniref:Reverse transcriptase-like protein n=1 Tax=Candidatus Abyssobacteria bacterium SURF_17 TaxID=2093361 RepID=A0A419F9L3_9BACT|nr:MAG: reverse transcriptase-like protein [Candidatus Abyssubacteria bacterium SURF_17]